MSGRPRPRKGGTVTTLTRQQAVDEGLRFGWIDGQGRRTDQDTSWIRYTPRRPRRTWSQRNVAHVARLEAQGLMQPSGRAAVDAAKADGRWVAASWAAVAAVVLEFVEIRTATRLRGLFDDACR